MTYAPVFDAFGDPSKLVAHDSEIPLCGNGASADGSDGVSPDAGAREYSLVFPLPEDGDVWSTNSTPAHLHVFLGKTGSPHDPADESWRRSICGGAVSTPLITYKAPRKRKATKNHAGHAATTEEATADPSTDDAAVAGRR